MFLDFTTARNFDGSVARELNARG